MRQLVITIVVLFFWFLISSMEVIAQNSLRGQVFDKESGLPLWGAMVYIPDLKSGSTTDEKGSFFIGNLPVGAFLIEAKYIGYRTYSEVANVSSASAIKIFLIPAAVEAQGVVITGSALSSDNSRTSVSVVPIDKRNFTTQGVGNLIAGLSHVPGIAEITTGGSISKPVIRGLGYNRIVTLNEGVRQEGNQWGDEHGIEIDQFSADRIEILKGPASLFYGSDAMGGVINILEPIPATAGAVRGELGSVWMTNNKMTGNTLMTEGNVNGLIFRMRGSYKNAASYKTAREYVYNSGFQEKDFSVMAGLNKKWGYSHLHYSIYQDKPGMIEGERDSLTGRFVDNQGVIVPDHVLKGRAIALPFQLVEHQKVTSVSNLILKGSQLKIALGFQQNERKEFSESRSEPGLFLKLHTYTYDFKFIHPFANQLESAMGVSGILQQNQNHGYEFLVPDYQQFDIGCFGYLKKSFKTVTLNAGIRYDYRNVHGNRLDTIFHDFSGDYKNISGAMGLTWKIHEKVNLKFNVGRAFRAPNIAELASDGVHEGTFRYESGNDQLKAETSLQFDAEISWNENFWGFTFNAYHNTIDHFIYLRNLNMESKLVSGVSFPVYRFVQGKSVLKGIEASLDIHPKDHFHFENSLSYVYGQNISLNTPLPLIPAMHSHHSFQWNIEVPSKCIFKSPYLRIGLDGYWKQDRIDQFETVTGSYSLWSAGVGTDLRIKNQVMTIFVEAENLANKGYDDHLNRLKYVGIQNMGRNVTLGITLPFGLRK